MESLTLSFDKMHIQWQLAYSGSRWREYVIAVRMLDAQRETRIMFWQGLDSRHGTQTVQESWEMFEFWTKNDDLILWFVERVAERMQMQLTIK
jgi:hypothetical protein